MVGRSIIRKKACSAANPPQLKNPGVLTPVRLLGCAARADDHEKYLQRGRRDLRKKSFISPASRWLQNVGTTKTSSKVSADVTNSLRPHSFSEKRLNQRKKRGCSSMK